MMENKKSKISKDYPNSNQFPISTNLETNIQHDEISSIYLIVKELIKIINPIMTELLLHLYCEIAPNTHSQSAQISSLKTYIIWPIHIDIIRYYLVLLALFTYCTILSLSLHYIIDNNMDIQRTNQSLVYKHPNWNERKKELKTTRNQRTTKSIKNIKVIDTPSDPNFNYCSIDVAPSNLKAPKYCDITGYETKYKDSVSGLYFYDKSVNNYIKMLSKPVYEQFLILRGQTPIDKVV